jgi:hypothetical protein
MLEKTIAHREISDPPAGAESRAAAVLVELSVLYN